MIIFCVIAVSSQGQTKTAISESLVQLSDSVMKGEIASFTITGAALNKTGSLAEPALTAIPIRNCSDKEVHLSWNTFTSSVSTFIHLYFKGRVPNRTLDSIFLVTHSHFGVKFPVKSFQGLYQSNACNFSGHGKKSTFFSQYYKAFYSADKKQLYIYMLGGTESSKYKVTWVIVEDKYYSRILDSIHD